MNRDVCEHFNPVDLPCDKCKGQHMNKPEFHVERGPMPEPEPFAIGMAKLLEREGRTVAAAELRRLHAECEHHKAWVAHITAENKSLEAQRDALLEALKVVIDDLMYKDHARVIDVARAAIAKAEGEKA